MGSASVAPGLAPPWWLEEALAVEGEAQDAPPLEGDHDADVAIIGGGYTGLWTALALRQRDPRLEIAILEKEIVGWGPSGRNGGVLHGYWTHLTRLRGLFGGETAIALARASERIIPAIRGFAEARGTDIWLREAGYLKVSASRAQDAAIDRAVATARELGVEEECVPLGRAEVAERVGSPVFRRGAFFRDGATVQPARLARALRRAALAEGIGLHERTPVTRLAQGGVATLETPGGRLRAREVVVATNAWAAGWRPVARKLTNFGSYVVLTEPVPDLIEQIGWTGGEAVTDGRMFVHYARTTADGRVLMGSGSGPIGLGGVVDGRFTRDEPTAARAEAGLLRLLPVLSDARIDASWGGPIDVSADHLPFYGTVPGTRTHYGMGYSGSGVGASWLGAQILASLVTGANDEWTALPLVGRTVPRLPPEPISRIGGGVVRSAILSCEQAEEGDRRGPLVARAAARLPGLLGIQIGTR